MGLLGRKKGSQQQPDDDDVVLISPEWSFIKKAEARDTSPGDAAAEFAATIALGPRDVALPGIGARARLTGRRTVAPPRSPNGSAVRQGR